MNKKLSIVAFILFIGIISHIPEGFSKLRPKANCPATFAEWLEWRFNQLESNLPLNYDAIENVFFQCEMPRELRSCMETLKTYSGFVVRAPQGNTTSLNAAGFTIPDAEYLKRIRPIVTPELDLLTPELLETLAHTNFTNLPVKLIQSHIDSINNKRFKEEERVHWVPFFSHVEAPDNRTSYERILIYDPKPIPRFISFAMRSRNVSVVAVNPDDSEFTKSNPSGVYFKDFSQFEGRLKFERPGPSGGKGKIVDNCASCHISGLIPIRIRYNDKQFDESVNFINRAMQQYSKFRPAYIDPNLTGPAVGPVLRRPSEFIMDCSKISDEKSARKIAHAMNCSACHNGNFQAKIVLPAPDTVYKDLIMKGHMPPHSDLTLEERRGLVECLRVEYEEGKSSILHKYFTLVDCPQEKDLTNASACVKESSFAAEETKLKRAFQEIQILTKREELLAQDRLEKERALERDKIEKKRVLEKSRVKAERVLQKARIEEEKALEQDRIEKERALEIEKFGVKEKFSTLPSPYETLTALKNGQPAGTYALTKMKNGATFTFWYVPKEGQIENVFDIKNAAPELEKVKVEVSKKLGGTKMVNYFDSH